MKTTIDIPDDLLRRARAIAQKHKMSLKTLTEEGLRLVMERLNQPRGTPIEPFVVTGKSPGGDLSWRRFRDVLYGGEGEGFQH